MTRLEHLIRDAHTAGVHLARLALDLEDLGFDESLIQQIHAALVASNNAETAASQLLTTMKGTP